MPRGRPKGSKNKPKSSMSASNDFVVIKNRPGIKTTTFNRATAARRAQLLSELTGTTSYARKAGPRFPKGGYKALLVPAQLSTSLSGRKSRGRPRKTAVPAAAIAVSEAPKRRGRPRKTTLTYDPTIVAPATVGRAAKYVRSAKMRSIEGPMLPRGSFKTLNSKARLLANSAAIANMIATPYLSRAELMV
jgi:hypothetical protein